MISITTSLFVRVISFRFQVFKIDQINFIFWFLSMRKSAYEIKFSSKLFPELFEARKRASPLKVPYLWDTLVKIS